MIVLAHRGWWTHAGERNSMVAFERALSAGFGLEIDVRDQDGRLVISHDPPVGEVPELAVLLEMFDRHGRPAPLAINIKSDGLQAGLARLLAPLTERDFFVFDMSIPDTLGYLRAGLTVFTRQSEHEPVPALLDEAAGVWMDMFESDWVDAAAIRRHADLGLSVALVSPELHGRSHRDAWEAWRAADGPGVMLCTDFPAEAKEFFHGR